MLRLTPSITARQIKPRGAWAGHEKVALAAAESEVRAANVALSGVQKELQGGRRTTLDVLNARQDLMLARARLIGAPHHAPV